MTDQLQIELGAAPWAPTAAADDFGWGRVWNIPLSGTFKAEGYRYAFQCLTGEVESDSGSLWGYTRINMIDDNPPEARSARALIETPSGFDVALAIDNSIVAYAHASTDSSSNDKRRQLVHDDIWSDDAELKTLFERAWTEFVDRTRLAYRS